MRSGVHDGSIYGNDTYIGQKKGGGGGGGGGIVYSTAYDHSAGARTGTTEYTSIVSNTYTLGSVYSNSDANAIDVENPLVRNPETTHSRSLPDTEGSNYRGLGDGLGAYRASITTDRSALHVVVSGTATVSTSVDDDRQQSDRRRSEYEGSRSWVLGTSDSEIDKQMIDAEHGQPLVGNIDDIDPSFLQYYLSNS